MPSGMSYYPQAVVLNGKVCIGGGKPTSQEPEGAHVMIYDLEYETWTTLPPYSHISFGMAVVNNQLLLIGGELQHPTVGKICTCLLYTSPSPRDATLSRMPSSA